jgi:hypothetical protein
VLIAVSSFRRRPSLWFSTTSVEKSVEKVGTIPLKSRKKSYL